MPNLYNVAFVWLNSLKVRFFSQDRPQPPMQTFLWLVTHCCPLNVREERLRDQPKERLRRSLDGPILFTKWATWSHEIGLQYMS